MEASGQAEAPPKRRVYCPECTQWTEIDLATKTGVCRNPNCPTPYRFLLAPDRDRARQLHDQQASWMPKFYFQVKDSDEWAVSYYNEPMQPFHPERLQPDLISLPALRLFESAVSDALREALVIIQPRPGVKNPRRPEDFERIDPPSPPESAEEARERKTRQWCQFCKKLRDNDPDSDAAGNQACLDYDFKVAAAVWRGELEATRAYQCWAGLIDYTVPVRLDGNIVALCFSGQKRPGPKLTTLGNVPIKPYEQLVRQAAKAAGQDEAEMVKLASAEDIEEINSEEEAQGYVRRLQKQLVSHLEQITHANYLAKRQMAEHYFLREVSGLFGAPGGGGITADLWGQIGHALQRLVEFFPMRQCLFLQSDFQKVDMHQVYASHPSLPRQAAEELLDLKLDPRYRERLALSRLEGPRLDETEQALKAFLGNRWQQPAWIASIPLGAGGDAVLVFVEPRGSAQAGELLQVMDQRFLRQFAVALRTELVGSLSIQRHLTRIGHTLGLPAQAMVADAYKTMSDEGASKELLEFARDVRRYSKRLSCLAEGVRWGLTQHHGRRVAPEPYSLGRLLEEVWELFEKEAQQYGCTLSRPKAKAGRFPHIRMWKDELEIALHNLVDNAVKYSFWDKRDPRHYHVEISGYHQGNAPAPQGCYCIAIVNYGIGIHPEELARGLVFRDGYRGRWTGDRNRSGSGIGLGVAREIIEQRHHGKLKITSFKPTPKDTAGTEPDKISPEDIKAAMYRWIISRDSQPGYVTTVKVMLPYRQEGYEEAQSGKATALD